MNETPRSERIHIALFGRRNAGKSSLINALTGQNIAVVSAVKGTTTDPVYKAMELLPLGPVVFIDTAGLDDEGELGELRKKKSLEVLYKTDIALLVIDPTHGLGELEVQIADKIKSRNIPLIAIVNKADIRKLDESEIKFVVETLKVKVCEVSSYTKYGIDNLKKIISESVSSEDSKFSILGDLVSPGDVVVLVTPIDKAAPKGRLILPQQQTIRDLLECDCIAVVTKEHELKETLSSLLKKPKLVITDSQVFLKVAADTPKDIMMTSFSILFARHKGDLSELVKGAAAIRRLQDGDKILIAEACTHHQQPDDIGKVKIPRWLRQATGKSLIFEFSNGISYPENLREYSLVVHCGGCMLNKRAMNYRIEQAVSSGVPIVNYGVLIAYVQGMLERALRPFPAAMMAWQEQQSKITI